VNRPGKLFVAALLLLGPAGFGQSRVVQVRDPAAVTGLGVEPSRVRAMVSAGIRALAEQPDEAAAWRQFVSTNDVVGIKINAQLAPLQGTRRAVVEAIVEGLMAAGVPPARIIVWDRDAAKLRALGYPAELAGGVRVQSVVPETGWDEQYYFQNNLVGKLIWGDLLFGREDEQLSTRSHLPRLLTRTLTRLINVPVLQDHDACGLAGCLYNISHGAVDNFRRFETMGQRGDPTIAEIAAIPVIREKLVLNVMDALIAGHAGWPAFKPQYSWPHGALYFSRDPVAIDSICLELLEAKRREAKVTPIGERASAIATAARAGLGHAERDRIEHIHIAPSSEKF
jgi:uncharacterized protein (DUF362 family)